MGNPTDFQFPPNQTQHNPGPIKAGHKASTLPKTENTKRHSVAGGAIFKVKAHIPDLNVPLVQYKCALCGVLYDRLRAICGHMKKHRNRSWKGLEPPSTVVSFNLNEPHRDEDSEI